MTAVSAIDLARRALPAALRAHPAIAALADRAAVVLHGSRAMGLSDDFADVDLWVLTGAAAAGAFEREHGGRFVEFSPEAESAMGARGHFNVESIEALSARVRRCDFPLIAELRTAVALADPGGLSRELLALAGRPMSDTVRLAWFRYHYVEMRGEHRACDNAIERGDATALLLQVARTLEHAIRAASVLDREPYRYGKWLAHAARRTPSGAAVVALAERAIALIEGGALRVRGPEDAHPLTGVLKSMRRTLVESARAGGIDGPWLVEWWLHIDNARRGVDDIEW
jgi:hypothetical protein